MSKAMVVCGQCELVIRWHRYAVDGQSLLCRPCCRRVLDSRDTKTLEDFFMEAAQRFVDDGFEVFTVDEGPP